ncbi:competence protein ComK [Psychrobacillus sp. OK028]|uniref:competence protein ComK n=1 Tax=Psychrobacillus sp. OK028 TaxID=1884359 RepID=UPI000890CA53|nr:competence protein ComK [Psychrobacillus sp. OK028]SDM36763.1 competence protein ComK [Psychrobacillus sp. OK028]
MKDSKNNSNLIDSETLLLEAVFIGKVKTRIVTTHGIYYSTKSPLELLEDACNRFASTFEGRVMATRKLMNYSVKTPLLIEPNGLGAFPTMSYRRVECVWIFNHPFYVDELDKGKSIVHFMNGISVPVHTSKNVLLKQHQRLHTSLNIYSMNHRKK